MAGRIKLITPKGNPALSDIDGVRERMKGELIHLSDDGKECLKCGISNIIQQFVWFESEDKYGDHIRRCELGGT